MNKQSFHSFFARKSVLIGLALATTFSFTLLMFSAFTDFFGRSFSFVNKESYPVSGGIDPYSQVKVFGYNFHPFNFILVGVVIAVFVMLLISIYYYIVSRIS